MLQQKETKREKEKREIRRENKDKREKERTEMSPRCSQYDIKIIIEGINGLSKNLENYLWTYIVYIYMYTLICIL